MRFGLAISVLLLVSAPAEAKVFLTQDEALALAFPGCAIAKQTHYLTAAEQSAAAKLAGDAVETGLVHAYEATCAGKPAGTAYFDAHKVRTLPETLMIVVDADAKLRRIEVLAFNEPEDYLARGAWYKQFYGKALGPELELKKDIRSIAGASLTARATTRAVRRVLALHHVVRAKRAP